MCQIRGVEMCSLGGGKASIWGVEMCQIWGVEMCRDEVIHNQMYVYTYIIGIAEALFDTCVLLGPAVKN